MFGLRIPMSKSLPAGEFDGVTAILGSSSFTGKPGSPWMSETDQDGGLFYLDAGKADKDVIVPKSVLHPCCESVLHPCCESSSGWCSTRTCRCSTSEDTGYSTDNDQPSPQAEKSATKKLGKLSSFLKKREPKIANVEFKEECTEEECFCSDMASVKEVVLLLNRAGPSNGRRGETLCERLLGIIPGLHQAAGHVVKVGSRTEKVFVKGFSPDGSAVKVKDIRIGDWLRSVDGQAVWWSTIEATLKSLVNSKKTKVKLTLETFHDLTSSPSSPPDHQYESLVQLAVELEQLQIHRGDNSMGILYISMEGITSDSVVDQEDLVYSYPPGDGVLCSLRGMFYTLAALLKDSLSSSVRNSSFVIDGGLIHAAYHMEGRELLLIAVPDKWASVQVLNSIMADTVRLLRVMFGSVEEAMRQNKHQRAVDQLFSLFFKSLSGETRIGPVNQSHNHPSLVKAAVNQSVNNMQLNGAFALSGHVQYLPLSSEIMMHLSGIMTDFESADFVDMSDNYYGCRRSYTILGSSMFYKGYLICSHMSHDDLTDLHLYLSYHSLLALNASQRISQLVIWREIFPTRFCYEVSNMNNTFGYSEPHARWFLLVIGMKHGLFAVMLEAGGCAGRIQGSPAPDPFYIDQASCTLMQIQTSEVIRHLELGLCGNGLPQTVSIDNFLSSTPPDVGSTGVFPEEKRSIRNLVPVISPYSVGHRRKSSMDSDLSSENSGDGVFKSQKRHRMFPDGINSVPGNNFQIVDQINPRLGQGSESCIFHYCHLNSLEGMYISSPHPDVDSPLHEDLLQTFYKCCSQIHDMFHLAANHKTLLEQQEEPVFYPDGSFLGAREQGVLFHCPPGPDSRRQKRGLSHDYWVVGRKFVRPVKQEMYVCFHEATPQNIVEMAFRLGFGLLSPG